ncbi:GNAT family N-acetyltransferase [Eudoraea sp.]|uniref:GNAT family N-acetyltransferase n=2 Tax=Eudoraea sp. TaxID=1979955 RepID=UPI003C748C67
MKNPVWEKLPLINNDLGQKKRFELLIEGETAFIEYIQAKNNIIYLTHTEVPRSLEGNGIGAIIVSKTLEHIRENGFKMAPLCPFVAAYLKRNPGKADGLLAPGFSIG